MKNIAVSIIVPVYNVEKYLIQCMDSIVSQTLKNIEIICVNDGSTDKSRDLLGDYAAKDSRIKVLDQKNGGYGKAMNVGIRAAAGKYIGIVEPDDHILPEMYEKLYSAAEKNGCDIVKSDFYRFTGEGDSLVKIYNKTARTDENYNRVICPAEEKESFRFIMNTWCGIYRRDFVIENSILHNETPGASFQDNGFWFKGFCYAKKIMVIPDALYMNRRDNPGSSVASREKVYCGNEEYRLIYEYMCENPLIKEKFTDVFMMKRMHTYIFNLKRIASSFRHEYIRRFSDEFRISKERGELCKAVFTQNEWTELMQIIRDPEEYYYKVEQKRIKVSVILPVFNCERYLRQCLDSLATQTMMEFEVICVDDGSEDSSWEILSEYAAKDGRFTVIRTENGGAGAARNIGMKNACGEYLLFLDSDDYFEPQLLNEAYKCAEQNNADITVYRSKQYDNESGEVTPCLYSLRSDMLPKRDVFSVNDMEHSVFRSFMGWAWDKLYRRSFVLNNELLFQEQRTTNDMYFTYISLFKASRITVCDKFLYYQRRNVPGSLSATRERSWDCFYNALSALKRELTEMGLLKKYEPHFVDYALNNCLWQLNTLNEKQGTELFERLRNEWFKKLGIVDAPPEWFSNRNEHRLFCEIMESSDNYNTYKLARLKAENEQLKEMLEAANNATGTDVSCIAAQGEDYYRYCLEETRKSFSYKIGRAITWLPRKLRGW